MSDRITKSLFLIPFIALLFLQTSSAQTSSNEKLKHPDWSNNATIYEVNIRQYTPEGTFEAFSQKLPAIKEMGVNIIWLMPINPIGVQNRKGSLGSYYSVRDYKAVNPEFGTLQDFKQLVKDIHQQKMKVIIDWVANHTAWDNVWVKTHPEFYNKDDKGNFIPPVADWTDVIDLNYDNKELWDAMIDAMEFWVKECDIDGFRCDVADMVPIDFWLAARPKLDKIKKVFMLAEASQPYLHKAFDMTYNWPLKDLMNDIAKGINFASGLRFLFDKENREYRPDDIRMVFTSNHDENSWSGSEYERLGDGAKAFAVLCGTVPGMPLIYTGQEAGMNKRLRFFEKDTVNWKPSPMRDIYTKLNLLKEKNKALWNGINGGNIQFIQTNNENLFLFVREKEKDKIFALFNLSADEQTIKLNSELINGDYTDVFGKEGIIKISGETEFHLGPWDYKVYSK
jgi:glycosidase